MTDPANIIADRILPLASSGGSVVRSHDPSRPSRVIWNAATIPVHVDQAVNAARAAFPAWSAWPTERRAQALRAYKTLAENRFRELADLLCAETGKAMWEAEAEARLLAAKVDTTLMEGPMNAGSGRARITPFDIPITATRIGRCTFRPHGVMAVLGPFNFPAHLPNGHIVPALLAGNTVVFKPSDKTPAVGQLLAGLFVEALASVGAPRGVVNLVQGGADIATRLVSHDGIDGILFTGSWPVGRRILEANLDRPGRIIALELGGNNASVVMPDADLHLAAVECARAAFATTGQRCTCTRRILVHEDVSKPLVDRLCEIATGLVVGDPRGEVFMGPLIRAEARDAALRAQQTWISRGATPLLESRPINDPFEGHYISPGILRVPRFELDESACGGDIELFAPIVRVATVKSLDEAITQCNMTRFGLAASIFTQHAASIDRFLAEARAGCINVNTGTAGASGKLPFGGLGLSGNHRPAGAFALDYCAYPVASLIESGADAPLSPGMRLHDSNTR